MDITCGSNIEQIIKELYDNNNVCGHNKLYGHPNNSVPQYKQRFCDPIWIKDIYIKIRIFLDLNDRFNLWVAYSPPSLLDIRPDPYKYVTKTTNKPNPAYIHWSLGRIPKELISPDDVCGNVYLYISYISVLPYDEHLFVDFPYKQILMIHKNGGPLCLHTYVNNS